MKRYIVFVSSTKQTLEREREAIINSIIKLNYMPASMEFFPASNRKSWGYIQTVIDTCDYYALVLGARYGSIDPETGLSYTEREFRYALEKGIPTIAFLHYNPSRLPAEYHDNEEKLSDFYELVKKETLCSFWKNKDQLAAMLTSSLVKLIEDNPQTGWVKADELLFNFSNHPVNDFVIKNVLNLSKQPYRENVVANVEYKYTDDGQFLHVIDAVSYKCRAVNGSINKRIIWSVYPTELNDFKKISIRIKRPNGEEKEVLQIDDFTGYYSEEGFKFEYEITEEWNVDNLLTIIETVYLIPVDHLISWEMPELTYGFTLTMTFPANLNIFFIPYMLVESDSNHTTREGFFSYKFYNWVIPNEGLVWQFKKSGTVVYP
jgi:hypothetical protein